MRVMIAIALAAAGLGLTGVPSTPATAQYTVRAYNPSHYNNTRSVMNYRAASRATTLRRYCRQRPHAARCRQRAAHRRY